MHRTPPHRLFALALAVSLLAVPLAATGTARAAPVATLLQVVETSAWSPASPDPSGLEYLPEQQQLVIVDGEVDEVTGAGWAGVNVWFATLGNPLAQPTGYLNTQAASPTNNEPVGVAYDEAQDELYIAKDGSKSRIWVYRPGTDGRFGTADDVQDRTFTVFDRGVIDGEGLAFGDGRLWVSDGAGKRVWWFGPGADAVVGTADDTAGSWDTASLGQVDPEGLDYDTSTGHLWMISNTATSEILEVTTSGVPLRAVSTASLGLAHPAGLAVTPSSTGEGTSVWIADRVVDNGNNSAENDGRLYEIAITDGASGTNLLANGGFELADASGRPTGWTLDARFTRSADVALTGSFAGRHWATDNSGYTIRQDAAISGGALYRFAGSVNVPPTADAFKLVIKVQWRAGGSLSTVTVTKYTKATSGWVTWSQDLVAPALATKARVMMVVSSLNATIYVDDFSVEAQ